MSLPRGKICKIKSQEAQLILTNPRDAFRGQSRSPNMAPFDMLGMALRLIIIVFDFKNAVTLKTGLGVRQSHWICHPSIERI